MVPDLPEALQAHHEDPNEQHADFHHVLAVVGKRRFELARGYGCAGLRPNGAHLLRRVESRKDVKEEEGLIGLRQKGKQEKQRALGIESASMVMFMRIS